MIPKIVFISFFVSLICIIASVCYYNREKIIRWRYKNFYPSRVIRCIIHYDTTRTQSFYRLIPSNKRFTIDDMDYYYDKESTVKIHDFFAKSDKNDKEFIYFSLDGKKYKYDIKSLEKRAQLFGEDNVLEIHYWFNIPTPINFDVKKKDTILSAKQMNDMKVNDLFAKLLKLEDQNLMLMIILIITILLVLFIGINLYYSYKTNKSLTDYIKMVTTPVKSVMLMWGVALYDKH
jgi:hypothetical protein